MGVTLVAASGDDGVSGYLTRSGRVSCGYYPMFPASSPYVTAVSGTSVSIRISFFFFFPKFILVISDFSYRDQRQVQQK